MLDCEIKTEMIVGGLRKNYEWFEVLVARCL